MRIWHGSVGDRIHVGDETARRGLALGYEDHGSPGFGGSNDSSLRILSVCSYCLRPSTFYDSARHVVSLPRERETPRCSSASHRNRWKGFSDFMFWGCFSYDCKGPCHIYKKETPKEVAESVKEIEKLNNEWEPIKQQEWELETGMRRVGLRNKPGAKPKWKWDKKHGKLVRDGTAGGIDWWRYYSEVVRPKMIPFAKECCHDLSYRQVYRRYGRRFYTKEKKKRESLRSVVPFCPFGGTGTCHLGIGRCGHYDRYRPGYGAAIVTLPPPKTDCARTEVSVSLCVSILIPTSLHVLPCCRLRDPRCICRLPHRSSIGGSVSGVLVPLGVLRGNP